MSKGFLEKLKTLAGIEDVEDDEEIEEATPLQSEPKEKQSWAAIPNSNTSVKETNEAKDKVVLMQNKTLNALTSKFNLVVTEPKKYVDCVKLVDELKQKKPIIINLENLESTTARMIFDFLSGAVYALNGKYQRVTSNIFVFAPSNVDVSADVADQGNDFDATPKSPWK